MSDVEPDRDTVPYCIPIGYRPLKGGEVLEAGDLIWDGRKWTDAAGIWLDYQPNCAEEKFCAKQLRDEVAGMGKDVPTIINDKGGAQSKLDYRFDLIDPLPMFTLARIVAEGATKYGEWNWRAIELEDNLNHAISHIMAFLAGDRQDDHLGHAFCRLMFALSLHLTPGESERMKPEHKEVR